MEWAVWKYRRVTTNAKRNNRWRPVVTEFTITAWCRNGFLHKIETINLPLVWRVAKYFQRSIAQWNQMNRRLLFISFSWVSQNFNLYQKATPLNSCCTHRMRMRGYDYGMIDNGYNDCSVFQHSSNFILLHELVFKWVCTFIRQKSLWRAQ